MAAVRTKMRVHVRDDFYDYDQGGNEGYRLSSSRGSDAYLHEFEKGTLILDIVEPKTRKLLWQGSAQAEINKSASPKKNQKKIKKAIRLILKKFPTKKLP